MKKPNLQRLAHRSKIYLRKASPTILSGFGAAGVIATSILAVKATPKAIRRIRNDSCVKHAEIRMLIASSKRLDQHGSVIFRQQSAEQQRYSVYLERMC